MKKVSIFALCTVLYFPNYVALVAEISSQEGSGETFVPNHGGECLVVSVVDFLPLRLVTEGVKAERAELFQNFGSFSSQAILAVELSAISVYCWWVNHPLREKTTNVALNFVTKYLHVHVIVYDLNRTSYGSCLLYVCKELFIRNAPLSGPAPTPCPHLTLSFSMTSVPLIAYMSKLGDSARIHCRSPRGRGHLLGDTFES